MIHCICAVRLSVTRYMNSYMRYLRALFQYHDISDILWCKLWEFEAGATLAALLPRLRFDNSITLIHPHLDFVSRARRARNHQILAGLNYVIGRIEAPGQFVCEVIVTDILFSSVVKVMEFKALPNEINDKKKSVRTLKTVRTLAWRYKDTVGLINLFIPPPPPPHCHCLPIYIMFSHYF